MQVIGILKHMSKILGMRRSEQQPPFVIGGSQTRRRLLAIEPLATSMPSILPLSTINTRAVRAWII